MTKTTTIEILSGPCLRGHLFRSEADAIANAIPTLVHHYAKTTGLDVHPAEATLVEVRGIDRRTGRRASTVTTEVRVAGTTIATWR